MFVNIVSNETHPVCPTAEVFDVETNERVNKTYNNMQMPKVENKTIVIDDYSMRRFTRRSRGELNT